jgi:hypothetical protein
MVAQIPPAHVQWLIIAVSAVTMLVVSVVLVDLGWVS